MTSLTFFHADINQSEVEDSFHLAYDWIKSVRKNVNKSKAVTLSCSLLKYPCVICLSMNTFCTQSTEILTFVSINCIKLIRWVWCLIRPQLLTYPLLLLADSDFEHEYPHRNHKLSIMFRSLKTGPNRHESRKYGCSLKSNYFY